VRLVIQAIAVQQTAAKHVGMSVREPGVEHASHARPRARGENRRRNAAQEDTPTKGSHQEAILVPNRHGT
jgi:hypothetical protein